MIQLRLHLPRRLLQQILLRLHKLRDTTESRSAPPLGRTTRICAAQHRMRRGGRANNRAPCSLLRRRTGPREQREDSATNPHTSEAIIHTHLSLLPTDTAFRLRLEGESTASSPAVPSQASDTVRLPDGPTHESSMINSR